MTRREGVDGWVAPVTPLFGAPARASTAREVPERPTDDEGWFVPDGRDIPESDFDAVAAATSSSAPPRSSSGEVSTPPEAAAPTPRRLPTFADFDRSSRGESAATNGVVQASDRFACRRGASVTAASDEGVGEEAAERESPRRRIENVSTAALARRGLSEDEVRKRLMEKGFTAEQVEPEIQRLLAAGYLNDQRLAEEVIRIETERKGKGRSAIVAELRRRGIDAADFEGPLGALDSDDELERARELVDKKLSSLRNVDDETAKRRLYGALARRGFGGDVVRTAVSEGMTDRP